MSITYPLYKVSKMLLKAPEIIRAIAVRIFRGVFDEAYIPNSTTMKPKRRTRSKEGRSVSTPHAAPMFVVSVQKSSIPKREKISVETSGGKKEAANHFVNWSRAIQKRAIVRSKTGRLILFTKALFLAFLELSLLSGHMASLQGVV